MTTELRITRACGCTTLPTRIEAATPEAMETAIEQIKQSRCRAHTTVRRFICEKSGARPYWQWARK